MAMKFYPKKLSDLEALKKEKKRLQKTHAQLKKENIVHPTDFLSFTGALADLPFRKKKSHNKEGEEEGSSRLFEMLSGFLTSSAVLNNLIPLGIPLVKKFIKQNKVQNLAKEVFGGYLKWKILEVSYRWIRKEINKKSKTHKKSSFW
jgi:hypothetical protein